MIATSLTPGPGGLGGEPGLQAVAAEALGRDADGLDGLLDDLRHGPALKATTADVPMPGHRPQQRAVLALQKAQPGPGGSHRAGRRV